MPRTPADSWRCHQPTIEDRPKNVALSRPWPSVSVTSSREFGGRLPPVKPPRPSKISVLATRAITATCSPSSSVARSVSSVPAR